MLRFHTMSIAVMGLSLSTLCSGQFSFAADSYNNKKTTTVEQTTTQTTTTAPRAAVRAVRRAAPARPISQTTTVTVKDGELRRVLDEDALKKMSGSLCVSGFKAYVGDDHKNVCQSKANTPDIAYSCVWRKNGSAAYAPTPQGPCILDYAEHTASVLITKTEFLSSPPLPYGSEAHCCFRAAQGPSTSTVETGPTNAAIVPKNQ